MSVVNYTTLKKSLISLVTSCVEQGMPLTQFNLTSNEKHTTLLSAPVDTLLVLTKDTQHALAGSVFIKRSKALTKALVRYNVECSGEEIVGVLIFKNTSNGVEVIESTIEDSTEGKFVTLKSVLNSGKQLIDTASGICFHTDINKYFLADGPMYLVDGVDSSNVRYKLELDSDYELQLSKQVLVPNSYKYETIHTQKWTGLPLTSINSIVKLFNNLHYKKIINEQKESKSIESWFNRLDLPMSLLERDKFTKALFGATPCGLILTNKLPPNLNLLYLYRLIGGETMNLVFEVYSNGMLDTDILEQAIPSNAECFECMEWN